MQNTFQNYPKALNHPQYRGAVVVKWDPKKPMSEQPQGSPARFPPVVVNNKDQELQYASKGYRPAGVADEQAYMRSVLGADAPNEYVNVEYPAWRYIVKNDEMLSLCVQDKDEDLAKCKGWFKTPDAAHAGVQEPAKDVIIKVVKEKNTAPVGGKGEPAKAKTKRKYTRRVREQEPDQPPSAEGAAPQGEATT